MKKLTLAAGLLFSLGGISSAFGAADGTITFNGRVVDQTCTVTNGGNTGNFDVKLPTVNKTQLATAGAVAGLTRFNIELTGCKQATAGGTNGVRAYFLPNSQYVDPTTHNLINVAQVTGGETKADNVQIQLTHADTRQVIAVGENVDVQENAPYNSWFAFENDAAGTAKAKLTYYAQYVAVGGGAATAGVIQSKVEYNIIYK
ncbi:fimbrial protein [Haemophilus influenzae biotype aegyptius]|uniref:fimbrial protein n=1 Tax=Haemophilus influenzae TaxID=727 RepID=UPI0001F36A19|nr:fimbrial protein [Haemophilus influenzae]QEQ62006.1 type 1 fimbrial protein [Haemophilus influenzae biotype aegyptius]QEQ62820.1 type 1 fimbrial protein [Haemophilus influenzae biotype aegyptius]QEQ65566.1 type 1 fimbrial protein [Haemophilus influenzae biotype aegyptius]TMQ35964.1 fimbrial protein [Haemophilus influenzae biotype aegyptius]TMQ39159.1 fimbrial protein [Haemophilus influenzae biotype aegyptius]